MLRNTRPPRRDDMQCWNCGEWIAKQGNVCAYCGADKERSRQETKEDSTSYVKSYIGGAFGLLALWVVWDQTGNILLALAVTYAVSFFVQLIVSVLINRG